jgi:predicted outer membrane repeat protein
LRCSVVTLQDVSVTCVGNFVAPEGLLQLSGAGSSLRMTKSTIKGCASIADGGSIRAFNGAVLKLSKVTITRSYSHGNGGAVAVVGAKATVYESFFMDCTAAGSGGAVWVSPSQQSYPRPPLDAFFHLSQCTLQNNSAADSGGALAISESKGAVERSIFTGNVAKSGGAIAVTKQSSALVQDSRLYTNKALGLGGGAISVSASALELFSNSIAGNEAAKGGGGALLWDGDTAPIVRMDCGLGLFADPVNALGRSYCVPCAPGFFKESLTSAQCTACGAGTYSNVTASSPGALPVPATLDTMEMWSRGALIACRAHRDSSKKASHRRNARHAVGAHTVT